jgi:dTDP-4-dehydrorhamnose 3,5-epimerase
MIDGVQIKPLKIHCDERGFLYEMLRRDDPFFQQFGQCYLTAVYPGVVKGWHWHKLQTDHFVCVKGMAKVVLYDRRDGSKTSGEVNEFFMGERNPILLVIPAGVLHGMKGIGTETAMIVNIPTHPYRHSEPDEHRVDPHENDIPYDWDQVDF